MIERNWHNCYKDSWKGIIADDAFAHPAKFARGLIRRIYEHAFEREWLLAGDTVVDPFGGVALGALEAMRRGLTWIGCELEPRFCKLGQRNIDLWDEVYSGAMPRWGTARLLQGDSRELIRIVAEAGCCVSSPPYNLPMSQDHSGRGGGKRGYTPSEKGAFARYGNTQGQLEGLPLGDFAAAISSPPYAEGCAHTGGNDPHPEHIQGGEYYGVGIAGAISSPPYAGSLASDDPDKRGGLSRDEKRHNDKTLTAEYGNSDGQLGAMPAGEFAAAVSSPPYEANTVHGDNSAKARMNRKQAPANKWGQYATGELQTGDYGFSSGQLGQESGDTFWTAARAIVAQTYAILRPGAVAIWVTKAFVRNKQRVDFPGQWLQLCEACGFEPLEWIRAWLIEDSGTQAAMFGDDVQLIKERKSFFRRLAESKGSPPIDYEVVIVVRKP